MTCKYLKTDVYDYIKKLPLDRLKELHITGIQQDGNQRLRDSMPMTEEDWDLAEYCIPFEPAMQTFEPRSALN